MFHLTIIVFGQEKKIEIPTFDDKYSKYVPVSYTHLDVYKRQENSKEEKLQNT